VAAAPADACAPLTNAAALRGNVAFIARGGCNFTDKALRVQDAGARAVLVADSSNVPDW
jgi:indole-3-glycerol phosphate synthase